MPSIFDRISYDLTLRFLAFLPRRGPCFLLSLVCVLSEVDFVGAADAAPLPSEGYFPVHDNDSVALLIAIKACAKCS